jgi:hypothetical protein
MIEVVGLVIVQYMQPQCFLCNVVISSRLAGLGWVGLGWIGLDWVGLGCRIAPTNIEYPTFVEQMEFEQIPTPTARS